MYSSPGWDHTKQMDTLAEAQAWCCAHASGCGGVTETKGKYQPRLHKTGCKSPSGASDARPWPPRTVVWKSG